jgi:Na+-driven multidrug efflux pump
VFQALGNTVPALLAGATRLTTFAIPAIWVSGTPGFELRHLWMLSVATVALQAAFSWWLLQREFGKKLTATGNEALP